MVTGFRLLSWIAAIGTIPGMPRNGSNLDLVAHYAIGCLQLSHSQQLLSTGTWRLASGER